MPTPTAPLKSFEEPKSGALDPLGSGWGSRCWAEMQNSKKLLQDAQFGFERSRGTLFDGIFPDPEVEVSVAAQVLQSTKGLWHDHRVGPATMTSPEHAEPPDTDYGYNGGVDGAVKRCSVCT